jgi:hypothetical protein
MANESSRQSLQLQPEIAQQIGVLNARITNVNLANNDLLHQMDATFKLLMTKISALEQENAELKAKLIGDQQNQKTQ